MKVQILFDRVNHFHLLVRIIENVAYKYTNTDRSVDAVRFEDSKWETIDLPACEDLSECGASDSVIITSAKNNNIKTAHNNMGDITDLEQWLGL